MASNDVSPDVATIRASSVETTTVEATTTGDAYTEAALGGIINTEVSTTVTLAPLGNDHNSLLSINLLILLLILRLL